MYSGTAGEMELQESNRHRQRVSRREVQGCSGMSCCMLAYVVARMANVGNPSNCRWSSSGRWITRGLGGTDERELAEYRLQRVNWEGAEKSGEILRIERC